MKSCLGTEGAGTTLVTGGAGGRSRRGRRRGRAAPVPRPRGSRRPGSGSAPLRSVNLRAGGGKSAQPSGKRVSLFQGTVCSAPPHPSVRAVRERRCPGARRPRPRRYRRGPRPGESGKARPGAPRRIGRQPRAPRRPLGRLAARPAEPPAFPGGLDTGLPGGRLRNKGRLLNPLLPLETVGTQVMKQCHDYRRN